MATNEVRIIGGLWKGRKLKLPPNVDVRPTLGRVRESLFNWLVADIADSDCLDLFAGSGALGFEALSRGARHVVLVDKNRHAVRTLHSNAQRLGAANCTIRHQPSLGFLRRCAAQPEDAAKATPPDPAAPGRSEPASLRPTEGGGRPVNQWDIVFLDPPFASGLLAASLDALRTWRSLKPGGLVYFELERRGAIDLEGWTILKQGNAGDTRFGLLASC